MNITLQFNERDVANVKAMLRGLDNLVPVVLNRAINDTLAGVKTDASTEIRTVITATKKVVDGAMKISKSTTTSLSGGVEISGTPLPTIAFSARQTLKGVSVQVKKGSAREVIPGTFIAKVRSAKQAAGGYEGHEGVFWRVYHGSSGKSGKMDSAIGRSGYVFNKKTGRFFPIWALPKMYRLPIKQLFSPRIPDYIAQKGPVMASVLAKADDRMQKNIDKELNFEMSKL